MTRCIALFCLVVGLTATLQAQTATVTPELRHGPKDAFLPAAGSVFTLADQTRGDGLFVYVQAATIAMHSHGDPPLPLTKTPALEESPLRTLRMEVSLCGSYGVQLNLICGFNEPHHCHYPSLIAQWRIPLSLTTIFMLRCDRDIGHADLVTPVTKEIEEG